MEEEIARGRGALPCLEELLKLDSEGASPPRGRVLLILGLDRCYTLTSAETRKGKGSRNRQECLRLQTLPSICPQLLLIFKSVSSCFGGSGQMGSSRLCASSGLSKMVFIIGDQARSPPQPGGGHAIRASFGLPAFGVHVGRGAGSGPAPHWARARGHLQEQPCLPLISRSTRPALPRTLSARLPLEIYAPGRGLALLFFSEAWRPSGKGYVPAREYLCRPDFLSRKYGGKLMGGERARGEAARSLGQGDPHGGETSPVSWGTCRVASHSVQSAPCDSQR